MKRTIIAVIGFMTVIVVFASSFSIKEGPTRKYYETCGSEFDSEGTKARAEAKRTQMAGVAYAIEGAVTRRLCIPRPNGMCDEDEICWGFTYWE